MCNLIRHRNTVLPTIAVLIDIITEVLTAGLWTPLLGIYAIEELCDDM